MRVNNIKIDALGYGTLDGWVFSGEWLPAPDVGSDKSLGRYPDGNDTDNNFFDFHEYANMTPGEPNPDLRVSENKISILAMPVIRNPVIAGISFVSVISNLNFYPIKTYSVVGR